MVADTANFANNHQPTTNNYFLAFLLVSTTHAFCVDRQE
jgi:hypothetical protein